MSDRSRKMFQPSMEGSRLEARLALSGMHHAMVAEAAKPPKPTKQPVAAIPSFLPMQSVKVKTVNNALAAVKSAYGSFQQAETQAVQNAITALANGQNETDLVKGLKATTGLQGGILEAKLLNISSRFGGGQVNLYGPFVPPQTSFLTVGQPRAERNPALFLPTNAQRLQVQADALILGIQSNITSVQSAATVMTVISTSTTPPTPPATSTTTTTTTTTSASANINPMPIPPSIASTSMMAYASFKTYLQRSVKAGYLFTS